MMNIMIVMMKVKNIKKKERNVWKKCEKCEKKQIDQNRAIMKWFHLLAAAAQSEP